MRTIPNSDAAGQCRKAARRTAPAIVQLRRFACPSAWFGQDGTKSHYARPRDPFLTGSRREPVNRHNRPCFGVEGAANAIAVRLASCARASAHKQARPADGDAAAPSPRVLLHLNAEPRPFLTRLRERGPDGRKGRRRSHRGQATAAYANSANVRRAPRVA